MSFWEMAYSLLQLMPWPRCFNPLAVQVGAPRSPVCNETALVPFPRKMWAAASRVIVCGGTGASTIYAPKVSPDVFIV